MRHQLQQAEGFVGSIIIISLSAYVNPKMDMQKIVTLDGFGVRVDPRENFVKNATYTRSC